MWGKENEKTIGNQIKSKIHSYKLLVLLKIKGYIPWIGSFIFYNFTH